MSIKVKNRKLDLMQPSAFFVYCMFCLFWCVCGGVGCIGVFPSIFSFASHIPCFNIAFIQNKNRNILPWK